MNRKHKDLHPVSELHPDILKAFQTVFINRTDCYPLQLDKGSYVSIKKPLATDMLIAHLKGLVTIGAYALDNKSRAKWLCLNVNTEENWQRLMALARYLKRDAITAYLEFSHRGGHLWLFTTPLPGTAIRHFGKQLLMEYGIRGEVELYPKQNRLTTAVGSLVRLPFGIHRKTGRRYHFVTLEGEPLAPSIREQIALLANPKLVPEIFIDQFLPLAPKTPVGSSTPQVDNLHKGSGDALSKSLEAGISVYDFVR